MALFDNRHWLLTHIRNSFISCDDTGMCEAVIIDELPKDSDRPAEADKFPCAEDSVDEEDELSSSFDIQNEYEFGHRPRTNTAQRLERMEQERLRQARTRRIQWENPAAVSSDERELLFARKQLKKDKVQGRSMLSDEIERCPQLPKNPFTEFAKYDGGSQVDVPTRTYGIFLTMLPPQKRNYPFQVCILGSAKVLELIGFVCWKYMAQNTDPTFTLKGVESYGLFIAEDDGEVDWDFSSLDPKETVGKFGLAYLALVELNETNTTVPEGREMFSRPPETKVESAEIEDLQVDLTRIEALLYQSFHVAMLTRMRAKTEVVLGVSEWKIEIDPVLQGTSSKLWKQKAISYDIDVIVSCDIVDTKSSNRAVFRIVHYSNAAISSAPLSTQTSSTTSHFKSHDFEAEQTVAEEIVSKVNHILQSKSGSLRREYLAMKQKKSGRRRSFTIWPR